MRRSPAFVLPTLFLSLFLHLLLFPSSTEARGLYVGHGQRSYDHPWAVRLNLAGGVHGANDPTDDDFYADYGWRKYGAYGLAGLEFHMGYHNSLEVYASLRDLDDTDRFFVVDDFPSNPRPAQSHYQLQSESAGLTLRHYVQFRRSSSYWGVGGGVVHAESELEEVVDGVIQPKLEGDETAAEAHFLVGWDAQLAPGLSFGLEVGFRYTWLEDLNDFTGGFAGLRLGILLGGR